MRLLQLIFLLTLLCLGRTSYASTFSFDFTPTNVDVGTSLKANGTFTVSGNTYTGATGTVYSEVSGQYVGFDITGIDAAISPDYNPANIVFAFLANGESYLINGPPSAMLSDSDSIVSGTFSTAPVGTVPLPAALPLFGSALLAFASGRFWSRRRLRSTVCGVARLSI